jgi:endoglucanase
VHLESDWIDIKETNRPTTYADFKPDTTNWYVNGQALVEVGIYSGIIDEKKDTLIAYEKYFPVKMRHKVYLSLLSNLIENQTYTITSNYGNHTFTFNQNNTFCESIKVNQVGYALNSSVRYANFGIFMGDKGAVQLTNPPSYSVKDSLTNTTQYSDVLTFWGDDTGIEIDNSGEYVYRMDLSSLEEGKYYIEIDGIGRSLYFGIGVEYSRKIAKTHLRGMYHQRCGIALEEPYTEFERGLCHHEVAFTKYPGNGNEGEGWIIVPTGTPMVNIEGGYHDAADFDRRVYHTTIPLLTLNYYEAFENHFVDCQYNIPESGNGIPDFLDEALWGVKIWENLQLDSTNSSDPLEYGGVMGGTETSEHPGYGYDRADWENNGNAVYGTYAIYESTTYASAGFFAQASRLLEPYDLQKSIAFLNRAISAWNYCQNQGFDTRIGFKMYAALQLYLATATGDSTGDMNNTYHLEFRNLAQTYIINGGSWPYLYLPGNTSARISTSHFISYLLTDQTKDNNLANGLILEIKDGADNGGYMGWLPENYPYPQGVTKFIGWGAATAQGRYADAAAFMYRLSTDPDEKQNYFNIISQLGDYSLGLNPLGQSYVTGLGGNQVNSPAHLDSYWTKYGKLPQGGTQPSIGNIPGIVIYGFTEGRSGQNYQTAVSDYLYPEWDSLPGQRRWTDGWSLVNSNEFTTWETMVWNTCMYAVLYDAQNDSTESLPTADAGADDELCDGVSYLLSGAATNQQSVLWTTAGDGTFDDVTLLAATYTPGTNDISSGSVDLTLTAYGETPCSIDATDDMTLSVQMVAAENQIIELIQGWSGISSYLLPVNDSVVEIFAPVENKLIILMQEQNIYWPALNINSIVHWNTHDGYTMKMDSMATLSFNGCPEINKNVQLSPGWGTIPVLSMDMVASSEVFEPLGDTLVIAKEVAGGGIYWPALEIYELDSLSPGKAYSISVTEFCSVVFPDINPSLKVLSQYPKEQVYTPWNIPFPTPGSHVIAIDKKALNIFEPGDVIGCFTAYGHCSGNVMVENNINNLPIVAYGDDTITKENASGFVVKERMIFRIFRPSTNETRNLQAEFDLTMPNANLFITNGLSRIVRFTMGPTYVNSEPSTTHQVHIYPNPARDEVIIRHNITDMPLLQIIISSVQGQVIKVGQMSGPSEAISLDRIEPGIYIIKVYNEKYCFVNRLIKY